MLKKRYLFLILIICLFAISAVSAEEIDNKTDITVNSQDSLMCESVDESFLSESYGTFQELQEEINAVEEGGTLNLTKDYKYVNGSIEGIEISKQLTINGNDFTLYGNYSSRIFNITANNVILKNLNLINGFCKNEIHIKSYGDTYFAGAILWKGENGILINSTLYENKGSAIGWLGNNGTIIDSNIIKNLNSGAGAGGIYWIGDNGTIINSNISSNFAPDNGGGGIIWAGNNGKIINSTFFNNTEHAASVGGAILWLGNDGIIVNSSFINNSATDAGSIYWDGNNGFVTNSSFFERKNYMYETVIWAGNNGMLSNSSFSVPDYTEYNFYKIRWYGDYGKIINITFNNSNPNIEWIGKYGKFSPSIVAEDIVKVYKNDTQFDAKFFDNNAKPLEGTMITFTIDGINYGRVTNENGIARLRINLGTGNYTIISHNPITNENITNKITVLSKGYNITTSNLTKYYGENKSVEIKLFDENNTLTNGLLHIFVYDDYDVDPKEIYDHTDSYDSSFSIYSGTGIFSFDFNRKVGTYNILVLYNQIDYVKVNTTINILPAITSLTIYNINTTVGYETTLTANVLSSNNVTIDEGNVVFYMDDEFIGESAIYNGSSSLKFTPQNSGNYNIKAVFTGTDNYLASENNSKLIVNKASTLISIEDISAVYYSNQVIFTVNITSNSNKVNESKVKFYVNYNEVGFANVENGVASLSYVVPSVGNYDLGAVFEESDNYLSSNATAVFDVIKMPTTLSGNSVIFDDNDTKTYTTVLLDGNNNGVYNKSVDLLVIKYSGEYSTFNAVTDSNGISTYDINSLKGGMWYITGTFDGDNNYLNSSFADKFIVVRIETTTNVDEINNPQVNHTYKLKANIHDENGKLVKEGIVQFYLDGVDIGSIDLSKHGVSQKSNDELLGSSNPIFDYKLGVDDEEPYLEYTPTKAGNFTLFAFYEGTTLYKSSNSTTDFVVQEEATTIISAPDLTKYYHGPERFVVTVKDKDNKPVVGKNVTINLNGATYTRTTNENGEASMAINLNSGVYEALTKYNTSEVKSTITIKETVSGENITKMFRNGTQYYAAFYDTSGKTLAENTAVEFNINGVFYTRYTNEKGVARMNINLNPGEYVITAKNPSSTEQYTNIITVLPSIVENNDLTKYFKDSSRYTLKILDDEGNPAGEGVPVKLNINGVFYERKTNASGYVNMNINLNPGKYIITSEYNGLMASNNIAVLPRLSASDLVMDYKDGSKFKAKLINTDGTPHVNQTITFNINGVFYNRTTDSDGIASLNINLMPGDYIITSISSIGETISNNIKINHRALDTSMHVGQVIDGEFKTLERHYNSEGVFDGYVIYPKLTDSEGNVLSKTITVNYHLKENPNVYASFKAISTNPLLVCDYGEFTPSKTIGLDVNLIFEGDSDYNPSSYNVHLGKS